MAMYARINDFGFLEAPYFKVFSKCKLGRSRGYRKELIGRILRDDVLNDKGKVAIKAGHKLTKEDLKKFAQKDVRKLRSNHS